MLWTIRHFPPLATLSLFCISAAAIGCGGSSTSTTDAASGAADGPAGPDEDDDPISFGSAGGTAPNWAALDGTASDVGVGADGSIWVLGTVDIWAGNYAIYHRVNGAWAPVEGSAVAISVGRDDKDVWIVNSFNDIYSRNGTGWLQRPGKAIDVGVGANGSVWIIGTDHVTYRWNGSAWDSLGGVADRIAVGPSGNAWVVTGNKSVYSWNGAAWIQNPGLGNDIAVAADGTPYLIGTDATGADFGIYSWNGSVWTKQPGFAKRVAAGAPGRPVIVNSAGGIYQWPDTVTGRSWVQFEGAASDVGVGADGSIWVLGTADVWAGNHSIYHRDNGAWVQVEGSAVAISVGRDDNDVWVVSSFNNIYSRSGNTWIQRPGTAIDVGVGANGTAWIIGTDHVTYRWNGSGWDKMWGVADRIAVDSWGNAWTVNGTGVIYRWDGAVWQYMPGLGHDIAVSLGGTPYLIGWDNMGADDGVYEWNGSVWTKLPGFGRRVAAGPPGRPVIVNSAGGMYQYQPTYARTTTTTPAPAPAPPPPETETKITQLIRPHTSDATMIKILDFADKLPFTPSLPVTDIQTDAVDQDEGEFVALKAHLNWNSLLTRMKGVPASVDPTAKLQADAVSKIIELLHTVGLNVADPAPVRLAAAIKGAVHKLELRISVLENGLLPLPLGGQLDWDHIDIVLAFEIDPIAQEPEFKLGVSLDGWAKVTAKDRWLRLEPAAFTVTNGTDLELEAKIPGACDTNTSEDCGGTWQVWDVLNKGMLKVASGGIKIEWDEHGAVDFLQGQIKNASLGPDLVLLEAGSFVFEPKENEIDIALDIANEAMIANITTNLRKYLDLALPKVAGDVIVNYLTTVLKRFEFKSLAFAAKPLSLTIDKCSVEFAVYGTPFKVEGCPTNVADIAASIGRAMAQGDMFQSLVVAIGKGLVDEVMNNLNQGLKTLKEIALLIGQPVCAPGKDLENLLCYDPCKPGFTSNGATICTHNTIKYYDRGAGTVPDLRMCPAGQILRGIYCYNACKAGYHLDGLNNCVNDGNLLDYYAPGYGNSSVGCSGGKEMSGGLCYPPCGAGYTGGATMCNPWYDRGAGLVPSYKVAQ